MREEHLESQSTEGLSLAERLRENLDLLAFVLALAAIGLMVSGHLFPLPERSKETKTELTQLTSRIDGSLSEVRYDADQVAREAHSQFATLKAGWSKTAATTDRPPNSLTYPESLLAARRKGESNRIVFLPPLDVVAHADHGVIRLSWTRHQDNNVEISEYAIHRAEGRGQETELLRVGGNVTAYEDRAIKAGYTYTYRIMALTTDLIVLSQIDKSAPSEPSSAEAVADFRLTLEAADIAAQKAEIRVEKWHGGSWWPKKFVVAVGTPIGSKDEGSGVDFTTGRTLKTLRSETGTETVVRHDVVFDDLGRVRLVSGIPMTEERT